MGSCSASESNGATRTVLGEICSKSKASERAAHKPHSVLETQAETGGVNPSTKTKHNKAKRHKQTRGSKAKNKQGNQP